MTAGEFDDAGLLNGADDGNPILALVLERGGHVGLQVEPPLDAGHGDRLFGIGQFKARQAHRPDIGKLGVAVVADADDQIDHGVVAHAAGNRQLEDVTRLDRSVPVDGPASPLRSSRFTLGTGIAANSGGRFLGR